MGKLVNWGKSKGRESLIRDRQRIELFHGGLLPTVLRASAESFDVDGFLADCDWNVSRVFRRGELTRRKAVNESSGFNVTVSTAGFDEFAGQIADAEQFLTTHADTIRSLVNLVGANNVVLDFGVRWRDAATQSDRFPPELVRAAASCGIALEISRYPISDG